MDKFEKHIQNRKDDLDDRIPPKRVWEKIENELFGDEDTEVTSSGIWSSGYLWKAAAVIFFALSAYLMVDKFAGSDKVNDPLWAEFKITEQYYSSLIEAKQTQVNQLVNTDSELYDDFNGDLNELDSMYNVLVNEYQDSGSEQVMEALIQNLRVRLNILDDQLKILENVNKYNNNEDETITI